MMNEERFAYLLDHYITGDLQEPEQQEFFAMLEEPVCRNMLEKRLEEEWQQHQYEETANEQVGRLIEQHVLNWITYEQPVVLKPRARVVFMRRAVAVAVVLGVMAGAGYFLLPVDKKEKTAANTTATTKDLSPGGNKAVLTLSDGKQIVLDSVQNGLVVKQGAAEVNKAQNGQLLYKQANNEQGTVLNKVSTPRGGEYRIQLADGTWVWLNAESSLRFPTTFTGDTRTVEVTGEAYFEVAHNAAKPFKVLANGTEIEVLGTHFNVHAYSDEPLIKTTLIQGKVKIVNRQPVPQGGMNRQSAILKPGEQAVITADSRLTIHDNVDTEEVLAWKNGLFRFDNADIESIMKQVERWYNVDVVYEGPKPEGHFRGKIPRNVMASEMLKIIEASGIQCRIEKNKIIITK